MSSVVIEADRLSKQYRLGQISGKRLVDDLNRWWARMRGREDPLSKIGFAGGPAAGSEALWALRDVSFEVRQGEVLGIIGRNGAGKSTLLKILSRVTSPTRGEIRVKGRIASLLEVGTGFHPELTGRENVFLNGAILGMTKAEITRKFDEIVAFAEVDRFIDTPVKRYSSGMYVRLAFAVAAHLEPEILIVDEVLAVGDAEFQKKCLGKMKDVAGQGRTILFVSHNMSAINRLCSRCLLLCAGTVENSGRTEEVVSAYLSSGATVSGERVWEEGSSAPGTSGMRLLAVRVLTEEGNIVGSVDIRKPFDIEIRYRVLTRLPHVRVALRLLTSDGEVVFTSSDSSNPVWENKPRDPGDYISRCRIPGHFLNDGRYSITVSSDVPFSQIHFFEDNVLSFHVEQTGGAGGRFPERWPGVVCPALQWQIEVPSGGARCDIDPLLTRSDERS